MSCLVDALEIALLSLPPVAPGSSPHPGSSAAPGSERAAGGPPGPPAPPRKRPEVLARAVLQIRERLLDDVEALVAQRHLDAGSTASLAPRFGYKGQVDDVLALVAIYRAHWQAVAAATRVRPADLEHAEALAGELAAAFPPALWSRRSRRAPRVAPLAPLQTSAVASAATFAVTLEAQSSGPEVPAANAEPGPAAGAPGVAAA